MSTTIGPNQLITLDPGDKRLITFDWDADNLAADVEIDTSTFTITAVKQNGATALTKDNPTVLAGNRKTQVRLDATTATAGDRYQLDNTIVTNETPAQTKERSILVLVQNR